MQTLKITTDLIHCINEILKCEPLAAIVSEAYYKDGELCFPGNTLDQLLHAGKMANIRA